VRHGQACENGKAFARTKPSDMLQRTTSSVSEQVTLAKPTMAVLREAGMIRDFILKSQLTKPRIRIAAQDPPISFQLGYLGSISSLATERQTNSRVARGGAGIPKPAALMIFALSRAPTLRNRTVIARYLVLLQDDRCDGLAHIAQMAQPVLLLDFTDVGG
jgi:hypothetical protein